MAAQQLSIRAELRALWALALPIAGANLGQMLLGLVDLAVVGRLGQREIGATGRGNTLFFLGSTLGMGSVLGLDALVSQAVGAGELKRARQWWVQGLWLALFLGVPIAVVAGAASFGLERAGIEPQVAVLARSYAAARLPSVVPFLAFIACRSFLQAHDVTRPMVRSVITANVVNVPLAVLLVFGDRALVAVQLPALGLPALGVAGAALANSLTTLLQLGIVVHAVVRRPATPLDSRRPDPALLAAVLRLGVPIALTMFAEYGVFAIAGVMAGNLGSHALAGHQVALTCAATAFMVPLGIGAAAAVRVGHAIGAGDRRAARRSGFLAIASGAGFMLCSASLFLAFPEPIARLLAPQPESVAAAVPLLFVAAVFQLSDGVQAVAAGALRGAGDTRWPLALNLAGYYLVGLPIAVLCGFRLGFGARGLWWGLSAGLGVVAIGLVLRFHILSSRDLSRS